MSAKKTPSVKLPAAPPATEYTGARTRRLKRIWLSEYDPGTRTNLFVKISEAATGQPMLLPVIVARGAADGPVVGIMAAVHGNELNGIRIIHSLLETVNLKQMSGSLLCAPILNLPGFNLRQREFSDGRDLNHYFPGREKGVPAEQYARAITRMLLPPCDYLIDIHTASVGRINTMYLRADLHNPTVRRLSLAMNPQIILHVRGGDGTLRHAARQRGIHGITLEAGNPDTFQGRMVFSGEEGLTNILVELGMCEGTIHIDREAVICHRSSWLRTTSGGLLKTHFDLGDRIKKRQLMAQTLDPFGTVLKEYHAPRSGIVIGMAVNPLAVPGTRYCHLGEIGEPEPPKPQELEDRHEDPPPDP